MTMDSLIERMEQLNTAFVGGDLVDLAISPAVAAMLVEIKNRVRNKGEGTDGQALSPYSTKTIYASPEVFVKGGFVGIGKTKGIGDRLVPTIRLKYNNVKKNPTRYSRYTLVKPNYGQRKTMYLEDGYKELRDVQGLRTDITNMSYSGTMLDEYVQERDGNSIITGLTSELSANKYLGNTAKRGDFLQASTAEIEQFTSRTAASIRRLTVGLLRDGETISAVVS